MTDLRKAAEAVLEAWGWDWSEPRNEALRERMEALRQALAQPEQQQYITKVLADGTFMTEPFVDAVNMTQERVDETAKNRHEPVAWMCESNDYGVWKSSVVLNKIDSPAFRNFVPLYTAPPKREWVGLSSLDKTFLRTAYAQLRPLYHDKKEGVSVAAEVVIDWDGFFAAIEAKLKEKNT